MYLLLIRWLSLDCIYFYGTFIVICIHIIYVLVVVLHCIVFIKRPIKDTCYKLAFRL